MADWITARALMGEELTKKAFERARLVKPDVSSEALLGAALGIIWELVEPTNDHEPEDESPNVCQHGQTGPYCEDCQMIADNKA